MSQAILNFLGWSFLPNIASGFVHNNLFRLPLPINLSLPGTAGYARDRRLIYISVVVAYLSYTVYQAFYALGPNFYDLLGVAPEVDGKTLRQSFRRLSQVHHPDKGGDEAQFRLLRQAYDALSSDFVRFGYDRFGPSAVLWQEEKTLLGLMLGGLTISLPFYIGSFVFVVGLGSLQQQAYGTYWRGLCLVGLAVIHAWLVCLPARVPLLAWLLPSKVQFEHVALLQSLLVTLLAAISQVGPVLFPNTERDGSEAWQALCQMAGLVRQEGSLTLHLTTVPFLRGNPQLASLQAQGVRWMQKAKLETEPELVAAKREANAIPAIADQARRVFQA